MSLEPIHVHVFFAQFPVALVIFGLLLFVFGLVRKAEPMLETAFYALISAGVASILAFFSGRFLASLSPSLSRFSSAKAHSHLAYLAVFLAIIFSVLVLWLRYLPRRLERYFVFIFLILLSALFVAVELFGFRNL